MHPSFLVLPIKIQKKHSKVGYALAKLKKFHYELPWVPKLPKQPKGPNKQKFLLRSLFMQDCVSRLRNKPSVKKNRRKKMTMTGRIIMAFKGHAF